MSETKFPISAINPITGALLIEWFMFSIDTIIGDAPLNIFVLTNKNYKDMRKTYGEFTSMFMSKLYVSRIEQLDEVLFIGEFGKTKIIVASVSNISEKIIDALDQKEFDFTIGATTYKEGDNTFSLLNRAFQASSLASQKQILIQIL